MATARQVIEVEGLDHGSNPIPVATRMGSLLFTGTVPGVDRETGELPGDIATEISNAFDNLGAVLVAAGAGWQHVGRVDVSLRDKGDRSHVNDQWLRYFPHEGDRPVRHVSQSELPGKMNVQLQIIAVCDD